MWKLLMQYMDFLLEIRIGEQEWYVFDIVYHWLMSNLLITCSLLNENHVLFDVLLLIYPRGENILLVKLYNQSSLLKWVFGIAWLKCVCLMVLIDFVEMGEHQMRWKQHSSIVLQSNEISVKDCMTDDQW